jgi:hypothetical protein
MRTTPLNTFVDFVGDFAEPQSDDDLPGKEVAESLACGLRQRGIEVLRIADERPEIGHCLYCLCRNQHFSVSVTRDRWEHRRRWQLFTNPTDGTFRVDRRKQ